MAGCEHRAELIYDTAMGPLRSGIRAAVRRGRHVLYRLGETELVLQMTPDRRPDYVRLAGQVAEDGVPVAGAGITLRGPVEVPGRTTDADGEFRVGELPTGSYSPDLEASTGRVLVVPLAVGAR